MKKVNYTTLFLLIDAIFLIYVNYKLIIVMDFFHKFIFLSKGVFLIYKILELWKVYIDEYKFYE